MIGRLIDLCARNKLLVPIAMLMFIGLDICSVVNTPRDALPDLSMTRRSSCTPVPRPGTADGGKQDSQNG
jgi:Cu/Ag efflux pump CusA